MPPRRPRWFVYVLVSASIERTYVGVTTDLERRLTQHNGGESGGAKATRAGRPWQLAASRTVASRATAQRLEYAVKQARGKDARLRALKARAKLRSTRPALHRSAGVDHSSVTNGDEPNGVLKRRV